MPTPRTGLSILPLSINFSAYLIASSIGMAKPIPSTPLLTNFMLVIPITSPFELAIGPPEFPELIAASVCITFITHLSTEVLLFWLISTKRSFPDNIPLVTVHEYSVSSGAPIVNKVSPNLASWYEPISATWIILSLLTDNIAISE